MRLRGLITQVLAGGSGLGNLRLRGRLKVLRRGGVVKLGRGVTVWGVVAPVTFSISGGRLAIGDHTFINGGTLISCRHAVCVGNNVKIGVYSHLMDGSGHELDFDTPPVVAPVVIEDNVWIGSHCIVLPGVSIGRNSVIGAGSIVTRDIPSGVLAAGNPARVVRSLSVCEGWVRK